MLEHAGIGIPREYYYPYALPERSKKRGIPAQTEDEYFEGVLRRQEYRNVGLKLNLHSYEMVLKEQTILNDPNHLHVYMYRHDKLRQAISWMRAVQTDEWILSPWHPRRSDYKSGAKLDLDLLREHLDLIMQWESEWERILRPKNRVFRIPYETVSVLSVQKIAQELGILRPISTFTSCEIQRDDLTEQWIDELGNEHRSLVERWSQDLNVDLFHPLSLKML